MPASSAQVAPPLAANKRPHYFVRGQETWFKLLDSHSYGLAGKFRHVSTLAEAYDLLRYHPAMSAYSRERYGSDTAFDEHVMKQLFRPMTDWAAAITPGSGNMQMYWFMGAIKLAVVTDTPYLLNKAAFWYESYLRNHFYSDGLSIETAFNYSAMLGFLFYTPWISDELMGIDFTEHYPLLQRIRELKDYPVVTLAGVESMHADEHAQFFTSRTQPPPGKQLDYQAHAQSQNFPDYGLTCLRAGAPGSRLELIMDYQNTILHAHRAALNLQLFYQGVNLLPDIGYNTGNANPEQEPWKSLETAWTLTTPATFANDVEAHNTGTALGSQFGQNSVVFERYIGRPESPIQMVQAEGKWLYQTMLWPEGAEIPPARYLQPSGGSPDVCLTVAPSHWTSFG